MDFVGHFCTILALLLFAVSGGYWMGNRTGYRDGYYEGLTISASSGDTLTRKPRHLRMGSTGGTESDASST